jgi:hypothetical protein
MLTALLGFIGVLVGAILTYLFSISNEWQNRRLETMVAVVTASARVVGAHERMYGLFQEGGTPPLTDDRAARALTELGEAHSEWRIARARAAILIPDDEPLNEAIVRFTDSREAATELYLDYPRLGVNYRFSDHKDREHQAWEQIRDARRSIVTCCQIRSQKDSRLHERLRLPFSKRWT